MYIASVLCRISANNSDGACAMSITAGQQSFSFPEAAILSVSTKNNNLWPVPKYAQALWGSILVTVDSY